jgi:hypothetical protein
MLHSMKRGGLLNAQFHVTRAIQRTLVSSSYKASFNGLRNPLLTENRSIVALRTLKIRSEFDVRSFSTVPSPLKKEEEEKKAADQASKVTDATKVAAPVPIKPPPQLSAAELEAKARRLDVLADLKSPPS